MPSCLQENVPPEVAERVTRDMLAAFERSLGLPRGALPPVVFTKTQVGKEWECDWLAGMECTT